MNHPSPPPEAGPPSNAREDPVLDEASAVARLRARLRGHRLQNAASIVLALAVLTWVFTRLDLREALAQIRSARLGWFALGFLGFYASLPIRGLRWNLLLRDLSQPVSVRALCGVIFRAWFVNSALPGRTGDLYGAYFLKIEHGVRFSKVAGTIFAARILDFGVLVLILLGVFAWQFRVDLPPAIRGALTATAILGAGLVLVVVTVALTRTTLLRRLPPRLATRYEIFVGSTFGSLRQAPLLALLTLVVWLSEAWRLWCVVQAIGATTSLVNVAFLAWMAALLSALPFTPGGMGTIELFYQQMFALLGLETSLAGAVIVLDRCISPWFILVAGGILVLARRRWLRVA